MITCWIIIVVCFAIVFVGVDIILDYEHFVDVIYVSESITQDNFSRFWQVLGWALFLEQRSVKMIEATQVEHRKVAWRVALERLSMAPSYLSTEGMNAYAFVSDKNTSRNTR